MARWYRSMRALATYNRGRIQHLLGVNVPFLGDRDLLLWASVRELPERVHPSHPTRAIDRVAGVGVSEMQNSYSFLR